VYHLFEKPVLLFYDKNKRNWLLADAGEKVLGLKYGISYFGNKGNLCRKPINVERE
jgi:hypothetical protein